MSRFSGLEIQLQPMNEKQEFAWHAGIKLLVDLLIRKDDAAVPVEIADFIEVETASELLEAGGLAEIPLFS
jgi:hypothetical protein